MYDTILGQRIKCEDKKEIRQLTWTLFKSWRNLYRVRPRVMNFVDLMMDLMDFGLRYLLGNCVYLYINYLQSNIKYT